MTKLPIHGRAIHGRGAASNPANRFTSVELVPLEIERDAWTEEDPAPATHFLRDDTRSIIARNNSPDVGFSASINPYRGCEHGCIYCYARPGHEYLGMSAGLDFETRILVKENAPELLRAELSAPKWKPTPLAMSGVTDPYQPIERRLELTRRCLEVLLEFRQPVGIITKNFLVTRDIDILREMAADRAAAVTLSVTSLDRSLQGIMEPRTSIPSRRLKAIEMLAKAGVPVGVNVAPVIPGLTDHELPAIVEAAVNAGATSASYIIVRLPLAVAPLFEEWLGHHFPHRKEKVLNRLRSLRGGKLNNAGFGERMRGEGPYAEQVAGMFSVACARAGITRGQGPGAALSTEGFRRPPPPQIDLFGS